MHTDQNKQTISMAINGKVLKATTYPMARLLDVIREDCHLTGTKEGCGEGECGACSVMLDGKLVNSCLVPAIQADGAKIKTIEGVSLSPDVVNHIQKAFINNNGAQCGICTPGMIMAVENLLRDFPNPTDEQIRNGLAGNLCRCTGFMKIFDAVVEAAKMGAQK